MTANDELKFFVTGPHANFWSEKMEAAFKQLTDLSVVRKNRVETSSIVCVFDHTLYNYLPLLFHRVKNRLTGNKTVFALIRGEPEVVMPLNYGTWCRGYDVIFQLGGVGKDQNSISLSWPWEPLGFSSENSIASREGVCMINANKMSLVKGELYSLRKKVALEIPEVSLFGPGWGSPGEHKLLQYLKALAVALLSGRASLSSTLAWFRKSPFSFGEVADKAATLARFKISVVIENSPTYLSEKLLDALASGTIPVYVGPSLSDFNDFQGLIVQVEPNLEAVREGIEIAKQIGSETQDLPHRRFLTGEAIAKFHPNHVAINIASEILQIRRKS